MANFIKGISSTKQCNEARMQLSVQTLAAQEPVCIELDSQATLADLKQALWHFEPASLDFIWSFVVAERVLDQYPDTVLLTECGIEDGATLHLIKHKVVRILTASSDKTAKIWNTSTGECTQTFSGHSADVKSAVFSADESSVLTASYDKTAKIWNTFTGECTQTFSGHSSHKTSVVFSADESSVLTASSDGTAKIWNTSTGECTQTFSGHSSEVMSAVLSADESSVLTASDDKTAKIWNTSTGECTQTFSGHSSEVMSAVFSAD